MRGLNWGLRAAGVSAIIDKTFYETGEQMTVRERIFRLLQQRREMTRQEIALNLSVSMPTALQNVTELVEAGILEEGGTVESVSGRKAKKLRLRPQAGSVLGINIALHQVELIITDLAGQIICSEAVPLPFRDETDWYAKLQDALTGFLRGTENVLCAGLSFPGIIDSQANQIVQSHIFGLSHAGLERFQRCIPFPLTVGNDANCACFAEMEAGRDSFVYVSLNESVGGAVVMDRRLLLGDTFQAGEVGHMLLVPGGRVCYCGKPGCADSYLSPKALEQDGWDVYLEHLAILLTNLRMMLNMDIVAGGQIGAELGSHWDALCAKAAKYDRFSRDVDYIFPCMRREYACAAGAAALAMEEHGCRQLFSGRERDFLQ